GDTRSTLRTIKQLASLNGAAGGLYAALCGRDPAPRCQDAELYGRKRWGDRCGFLDVSGAQHLDLHGRDRQACLLIGRQLACASAARGYHRKHGGSDGQGNLLHGSSPRMAWNWDTELMVVCRTARVITGNPQTCDD